MQKNLSPVAVCTLCGYEVLDPEAIDPLQEVHELLARVRPWGTELLGECPDCEAFIYLQAAA